MVDTVIVQKKHIIKTEQLWRLASMSVEDQMKFVLRLTPAMHKKIKRNAKLNNTSMNKEITNILADSFSKKTTESLLADIVKLLEKGK